MAWSPASPDVLAFSKPESKNFWTRISRIERIFSVFHGRSVAKIRDLRVSPLALVRR